MSVIAANQFRLHFILVNRSVAFVVILYIRFLWSQHRGLWLVMFIHTQLKFSTDSTHDFFAFVANLKNPTDC
ncbi:hypothetical protein OIU78_009147 [Salix suchowensis]|nr:hypothetical protein OIU78_009147 [Salix suchowensis]